MKVQDWTNEWLAVYVKNRVKCRTYQKYQQVLTSHILPQLGSIELEAVKAHDIQQLIYVELLENKKLAGNTINIAIAILKGMFASAEDAEIIIKNPCSRIKRVAVDEKRIDVFTVREQHKLEVGVRQDGRLRMNGILISLYTGLRIGELLALTWHDVDFLHNTITINKTRASSVEDRDYTSPKTKSSTRVLPIPPNILPMLKLMKKYSSSKWVIEYNGKPINERGYQALFERLQKRLGIAPRGFHALRHTFATRAMECGTDYKTLSELMGHANAMITINRYAHSLMDTKRKAINKISTSCC
ncbi:MAG: site-specific integrase [Bacteroides sp.]|nr:site-specific integrase [Bacillota bacterium]MCM1393283.1 site-specific integrase [[Eubacterium] siraeum]MCM1455414.1 site-specific integrase [Bacteroides sp.]